LSNFVSIIVLLSCL